MTEIMDENWSSKCFLKKSEFMYKTTLVEDDNGAINFSNIFQPEPSVRYICKLYYAGVPLAYCDFEFVESNTILIQGLYQTKEWLSKSVLSTLPRNVFKSTGEKILQFALQNARSKGAQSAVLLATDDGSGKLYRFYYNLGFRCIGQVETSQEMLTYNDFIPTVGKETEKQYENYVKCEFMRKIL